MYTRERLLSRCERERERERERKTLTPCQAVVAIGFVPCRRQGIRAIKLFGIMPRNDEIF